MDDMEDDRGGTYDVDQGAARKEIPINRTEHRDAPHGATFVKRRITPA